MHMTLRDDFAVKAGVGERVLGPVVLDAGAAMARPHGVAACHPPFLAHSPHHPLLLPPLPRFTLTGPQKGLFTTTSPELRRVIPEANGRVVVKVVYTVLEAQYQSALTAAVKQINATNKTVRSMCSCSLARVGGSRGPAARSCLCLGWLLVVRMGDISMQRACLPLPFTPCTHHSNKLRPRD